MCALGEGIGEVSSKQEISKDKEKLASQTRGKSIGNFRNSKKFGLALYLVQVAELQDI